MRERPPSLGRRAASEAVGTALLLAAGTLPAQELTDTTYARWRDFIRPKPAELAYQQIPWRTSFWDALVEAQAKEKPILLWTMNGPPLACT